MKKLLKLFKKKNNPIEVYSPCDGEVVLLENLKDEVFSKKLLGDGLAVKPSSSKFLAPISGLLETVYPTGHAYGISHKSGIKILVHIGLDTVELKGKGFEINVNQNDKIVQNNLMATVDLDFLKTEKKDCTTPIVVMNTSLGDRCIKIVAKPGPIKAGELLYTIV